MKTSLGIQSKEWIIGLLSVICYKFLSVIIIDAQHIKSNLGIFPHAVAESRAWLNAIWDKIQLLLDKKLAGRGYIWTWNIEEILLAKRRNWKQEEKANS